MDSLYGKTYLGGLIFYLDKVDGTGMVAAPNNQSVSARWGCQGMDITQLPDVTMGPNSMGVEIATGARIGDGAMNTDAILGECAEMDIAAIFCREFGPDWFMPSRGELKLMRTNLHLKGYGNFPEMFYFSSTEISPVSAAAINFSNGSQFHEIKNAQMAVRAAKAF